MFLFLTLFLLISFAAICYTDFRWRIIPDEINIAILAAGLLYRSQQGFDHLIEACAFGITVTSLMWSIRYVHHRLTGRIGLGLGDVKLAGAAAIWFSPSMFPVFLFLSSASALFTLLATTIGKKNIRTFQLPFGPFLAASLVLTWNFERFAIPLIGPSS